MKTKHPQPEPADTIFDLILEISERGLDVLSSSVIAKVNALRLTADRHHPKIASLNDLLDAIAQLQRTLRHVRSILGQPK